MKIPQEFLRFASMFDQDLGLRSRPFEELLEDVVIDMSDASRARLVEYVRWLLSQNDEQVSASWLETGAGIGFADVNDLRTLLANSLAFWERFS